MNSVINSQKNENAVSLVLLPLHACRLQRGARRTHTITTHRLGLTGSLFYVAHIVGHIADHSSLQQSAERSPNFQLALSGKLSAIYFSVLQSKINFFPNI
jgi:hypothetical protein